ncbi:DNA polymerase IV [Aestuariicella hydrocarbonica]|uniref:DNA polymerase IV n=1 Tax=Pseudomaricurvus hydrocarbonicus TaxID=1470433 RepID=A0A9E5MLN6_9GAMM|nr:DNA polymerase IV [Aestuariicella hydrocarbonica]NHO65048.1 DNA polymerase IV [Aestuariicella hydrocarbonica]
MSRKIIHVDADCFFAAIEMRDNPDLRDRPMAVGGRPDKRGVISTCNYEAREFGVRSAMASAYALRLCPRLTIVPHSMLKYREASQVMRNIFLDYTDLVEPLSLDEAFLDVSDCERHQGSATLIAQEIRGRVAEALGITVSAGVAPNKFIAKVASDWQKPDGLTVVTPAEADAFVRRLPVDRIFGVGKVTAEKMQRLGIATCGDLRRYSVHELEEAFGSFGPRLHRLCRGIDERDVCTSRRRKSLSVEHTYEKDLENLAACEEKLPDLLAELKQRLQRLEDDYLVVKGFVKVKFDDFTSTTVERAGTQARLEDYAQLLEEAFERGARPVRLLGVGVRFVDLTQKESNIQLDFFEDPTAPQPPS